MNYKVCQPITKEKISKKDIKNTKLVIVMCLNCVIGYFPNKMHTLLLYTLDLNTYYLYVAISSGIIWLSIANRLLIYFYFNDEFHAIMISIIIYIKKNFNKNDSTKANISK